MYIFIIWASHIFPFTLSKPKEYDSTKARLKTLTTKQRELKEFCCILYKQPRVSLEGGGHWHRLQGYKSLHGNFFFQFSSWNHCCGCDTFKFSKFSSCLCVCFNSYLAIGQPIWNSIFLYYLAHNMHGNWRNMYVTHARV